MNKVYFDQINPISPQHILLLPLFLFLIDQFQLVLSKCTRVWDYHPLEHGNIPRITNPKANPTGVAPWLGGGTWKFLPYPHCNVD